MTRPKNDPTPQCENSGHPARTRKSVRRFERAKRLADVERLTLRGLTIAEIAAATGYSERTVKNDRQKALTLWQESAVDDLLKMRHQRAKELQLIFRLSMEAYDESLNPIETITVEKDESGKLVSTTIKEEMPRPNIAALNAAKDANAEMRKLFGVDIKTQPDEPSVSFHAHAHKHEITVVEDAEWYGNDAHSQAASRIAASASDLIVPGTVQGGSVRPAVGQNGHGSNGHS